MMPATEPRDAARSGRLLLVDAVKRTIADMPVVALAEQLRAGDVVVVNDAATLPASLAGTTREGHRIELRLAARTARDPLDATTPRQRALELRFRAVLFGEGDWRTPTEQRPLPPRVRVGERLALGEHLVAVVEAVDRDAGRLLDVVLTDARTPVRAHHAGGGSVATEATRSDDLWPLIYAHGRPIQYAHLHRAVRLWDVQNVYAARPWCFEMASAGRALDWELLLELRHRGVVVVPITHAAGLSSTGDAQLDRRLPLDEAFEISKAAARAIANARAAGGRVIAIGTSVVRALESAAREDGRVHAMRGVTSLRLSASYRRAIVDGVLSGVHAPGSSHFELLRSFADASLLLHAHQVAQAAGYLEHEFGDFTLLMGEPAHCLARALSA